MKKKQSKINKKEIKMEKSKETIIEIAKNYAYAYPITRLINLSLMKRCLPKRTPLKSENERLFEYWRGGIISVAPQILLEKFNKKAQKNYLFPHLDNFSETAKFIAYFGATAFLSAVIINPFEVVGNSLALDEGQERIYEGIVDCVKKIYEERGVSGFFEGLEFNFAAQILDNSVHILRYFLVKDDIKNFKPNSEGETPDLLHHTSLWLPIALYPVKLVLTNFKLRKMVSFVENDNANFSDGLLKVFGLKMTGGLLWIGAELGIDYVKSAIFGSDE